MAKIGKIIFLTNIIISNKGEKISIMTHSNDSIRQLTETVHTLAVVVAKNESRYLSIEKTFRWAAVAFLCLTLVVFYMGFNMISNVEARAISRSEILEEVVKFFEDIEKMVAKDTPKFIQDVKTVVGNTAVLTERIKQDSDLLREQVKADKGTGPISSLQDALVLIRRIKEDSDMLRGELAIKQGNGTGLITSLQGLANMQLPVGTDSTSTKTTTVKNVMLDSLVLIHRLREDSDFIRKQLEKQPQALSISQELRNLNIALSSVPIMAEEMRRMNVSIGVMSYGMDSTMGRMGRMMPGGWW